MSEKVFISHKNEDSAVANEVAERVRRNNVSVYLDIIDSALVKDGPDLADYIRARMSECDQLIAVVSTTTKDSWWVPWEIGVASEKDFRIASFSKEFVSLPTYLEKWPALKNMEDVDSYCQYSQNSRLNVKRLLSEASLSADRVRIVKAGIGNFHKDLMRHLQQRRR